LDGEQFERARQLAEQAASLERNNPDAWHLVGVALARQGQHASAVDAIKRALALNPASAQFHKDLGDALGAQSLYGEAMQAYRCAIDRDPNHEEAHKLLKRTCDRQLDIGIAQHRAGAWDEARRLYESVLDSQPKHDDAWHLLGLLEYRARNFAAALACFDRALAIRPDHVRALKNRGLALHGLHRLDEALSSIDGALTLKPEYVNALSARGNVLQEMKRPDDALGAFDHALRLQPDNHEVLNNRGVALKGLKRFDEALASFSNALVLKPDHVGTIINLGNTLQELDRNDEAVACYDRALALQSDHAGALKNRGVALTNLRRLDEALASFDHALALKPDYAGAHNSRGMLQLLRGQYREGWADCEWRWQTRDFPSTRPAIAASPWNGENIAGRSILVFAEQGLGDVMQFARYLPLLVGRGAKVTFLCPSKLIRLLRSLDAQVEFVGSVEAGRSFEFQCALMSLPLRFETTPASIPGQVPYLKAEAELASRWQRRVGGTGFKIGIAWQGRPHGAIDRGRSFPLSQIVRLTQLPGVRLISLQKNDGLDQLASLPAGVAIETLGEEFDSGPDAFVDTAAVMENLDLVVTSDTAIAHLAGALGRRTWVVLQYVPDWRWMLDRDDSPWYPMLRLFRQETAGNWNLVFSTVERELRLLLENPDAAR
jgi:tetratricopeptide (TPR) repeat protein